MNKFCKILLISFLFNQVSFSQNYDAEIINLKNDTLKVQIKILGPNWSAVQLQSIQTKIQVTENGNDHEYLPSELKSFKVKLEKRIVVFDALENIIFAERLYFNKVKLYKYLKSKGQTTIRRYLILKPNDKNFDVPAMGLSNLITKKSLLPAIEDCPTSYEKIKKEEVKIKDEKVLIDFIKDYEQNCFLN
jgi:hypothetical protein